jgi:hypothetical protein
MRRVLLVLLLILVAGCGQAPASPSGAWQSPTSAGPWRAERSGTTAALYGVGCLSTARCFAAGDGGTLLATSDGGHTWRAMRVPASGPLYRMACVAPSTCYVIARPDTILVTHDAGAAWTASTLPVDATGYAAGSCAAGQALTGSVSACPLGLLDISCATAQVCYAVASDDLGYNLGAVTSPGGRTGSSIWLTEDGGATWASQPIPGATVCTGGDSCPPPAAVDYPLSWVSCAPGGGCWAGGNQFLGSHMGDAAALLETSVPGAPWRNLVTGVPTDDAGACPAPATCYAIYSTYPDVESMATSEVMTMRGQAWSARANVQGVLMFDIACPAIRTCYTAGYHGAITQTANGSRFRAVPSPTRANLYAIGCVTAADCYAAGADGTILART